MKPPLGDTLVICDMDNTLLTAKEGIPACNRAVIRLYTSLGGLFTVATGRPPESIRAALGDIRLSLPAISCNGALLYDFSTESVLHRATLNREQATTAILDILNKFPRMGVEVIPTLIRWTSTWAASPARSSRCPMAGSRSCLPPTRRASASWGSTPRRNTTVGITISLPPTASILRSCPAA